MMIVITALSLALLALLLGPRFAAWKRRSEAERSFSIRFSLFIWLVAFLFILALVFLPNKGRVLMMVPIFLTSVSLAKWWKNGRNRLRREDEERDHFARARRIN